MAPGEKMGYLERLRTSSQGRWDGSWISKDGRIFWAVSREDP
jgi:hypothetical protein